MANNNQHQAQKGFTLVELAIVMIIIGLLIGGILKGQQLIENSRITSTIAQVKAVDVAVSTFRDVYEDFPGDMNDATARLVGCNTTQCNNGNGNSFLNILPGNAIANTANEGVFFWTHLNAADLLGGMDGTNVVAWGSTMPATDLGGGFTAGYARVRTNLAGTGNPHDASFKQGHFLSFRLDPATSVSATSNLALTPSQAARLDRKMDDGSPVNGSVVSVGRVSGQQRCYRNNAGVREYDEASGSLSCALYIRFQQ